MNPSKENPEYTAVLVVSNEEKYEFTPVLTSLEMSHQKGQMAQTITLHLMNVNYQGKWLNAIVQPRQRVFLYANDGERHEEVFRGFVWSTSYTSSVTERELILQCYDNLIFLQESEDSAFFPAGYATKDIANSIFSKWGIPMDYRYESITHGKLPLRGALGDLVVSDILDPVKKQTGKKYALVMEKDTVVIRTAGDNESYYKILSASNALHTKNSATMDGMTTKVVILGKSNDAGQAPIEAVVCGDTDKWGTLQKLQDRDEETTLADAQAEAQSIVDENGTPKRDYELRCSDIPWVRLGDRIYVSVGGIYDKTLIICGIDRENSADKKEMTLTMEDQ